MILFTIGCAMFFGSGVTAFILWDKIQDAKFERNILEGNYSAQDPAFHGRGDRK